jgi:hypothetical protein
LESIFGVGSGFVPACVGHVVSWGGLDGSIGGKGGYLGGWECGDGCDLAIHIRHRAPGHHVACHIGSMVLLTMWAAGVLLAFLCHYGAATTWHARTSIML